MAQVTIYLDEHVEKRMDSAAKAAGLSRSRWVADLIAEKTASAWPESFRSLAGSWPDFPDVEEIREGLGEDVPRRPL